MEKLKYSTIKTMYTNVSWCANEMDITAKEYVSGLINSKKDLLIYANDLKSDAMACEDIIPEYSMNLMQQYSDIINFLDNCTNEHQNKTDICLFKETRGGCVNCGYYK